MQYCVASCIAISKIAILRSKLYSKNQNLNTATAFQEQKNAILRRKQYSKSQKMQYCVGSDIRNFRQPSGPWPQACQSGPGPDTCVRLQAGFGLPPGGGFASPREALTLKNSLGPRPCSADAFPDERATRMMCVCVCWGRPVAWNRQTTWAYNAKSSCRPASSTGRSASVLVAACGFLRGRPR